VGIELTELVSEEAIRKNAQHSAPPTHAPPIAIGSLPEVVAAIQGRLDDKGRRRSTADRTRSYTSSFTLMNRHFGLARTAPSSET